MKTEKIVRLRVQNNTFCRRIRVVQGDTGRSFRLILEDITMDGSEKARIYAKKPDGTECYNDCEVVAPNEVLMENATGQIFATVGIVSAEIQISKNSKTITTYTFEFEVEKSLTRSGAIQSSSEYGALEAALAKAEGFYNPTFSEAATRNNINSGESIPTLFGKIKKWFTDLNTLIKLVGNTDISGIGKGTITDALSVLNSKQFLSIPVEITIDSRVLKANLSYGDLAFGLLCVSFQIDDNVYANALICIGSRYDTKLLAFCGSNISKDNRVWDPASKTLSCVLEVDNHQIQLQKALLIQ